MVFYAPHKKIRNTCINIHKVCYAPHKNINIKKLVGCVA